MLLLHRSLLLASLLTISNFTICMEHKSDNHKSRVSKKKNKQKKERAHPIQLEKLTRDQLKTLYFENASKAASLNQEEKKSSPAYQQKKNIFGILLSLNGGDKSKTNAELYDEAAYSDDEGNIEFDLEKKYRHSRNLLRYSIPATQKKLEEKKQQSDSKTIAIDAIDEQIAALKKERTKQEAEQTDLIQQIHYLTQATSIFLAKRTADKSELTAQANKKFNEAKGSAENLKKITEAHAESLKAQSFDGKKTNQLKMDELQETKKRDELVQQHKAIEEKIQKLDGPTGWF